MVTFTSAEAQNRFGQLLDTAQRETVAITRHGRPAAFLVSPDEMAELLQARRRRGRAVTELEKWTEGVRKRVRSGTAALTDEQVNRLVHAVR